METAVVRMKSGIEYEVRHAATISSGGWRTFSSGLTVHAAFNETEIESIIYSDGEDADQMKRPRS